MPVFNIKGQQITAHSKDAAQRQYDAMVAKQKADNQGKPNQGKPNQGNRPGNNNKILNNAGRSVAQGVTANQVQSAADAAASIRANNPNVTNDFGTQNTVQNPDGSVSVTQNLTGANKQILEQGQGLNQLGQNLATQTIQNQGAGPAYRAGINYDPTRAEDAVYNSLTRGNAEKKQQGLNELGQQLANQGLQYSNDPNSQYQQRMNDYERRYSDADLAARQQATVTGLAAQNQFFGQNETQRANDQATYAGGINNAGALSQLGTGLVIPNFQPYQGANINTGAPTDLAAQQEALKIERQNAAAARAAAARSGRGGGGGGGGGTPQPQNDPAFG